MTPMAPAYYLNSPPSALIFDLAHAESLIAAGNHRRATVNDQLLGTIAHVEKRKILANPAFCAALARFTDEVFFNPCDGRTWAIRPRGLIPHCPPDRIGCERFDEPIPRHPGVRPDYIPRPLLETVS